MGKLDQQTVLVVGGSSGMGLGIAQAAAREGAQVIVAGPSPDKLAEAVHTIGERATYETADVTDETTVKNLFEKIGSLHHVAVTASPGSRGSFRDQSVEEAHGYMEGKFWSTYRVAWHAAPRLSRNGSLVFLTGGYALRPAPGTAVVTAAYGAVEGLTRALAIELAPLRVDAIRPGTIDTPLWSSLPDERRKTFAEAANKTAVGRVGTAADIGQAAVYLMTNAFVTGTILDVEGGALLR